MPADASDPVVVTEATKWFGDVVALSGMSITARSGRVTVLVGPNGAGKTTALRCITGALRPDSGTVATFGVDPTGPDGSDVRRRCGMVSAKPALYDRLSGFDNLRYSAELYGVTGDVGAAIGAAAERFDIAHALDQQVGGYSTGMKTRLALSRAVLHDPELLLLDEPTSGLDPESSVAVLRMIDELAASGAAIVMCTHLLAEAEGLADDVVVLDQGADLVAGPPDELARAVWPAVVVRLEALGSPPDAAAVVAAGARHLDTADGVTRCEVDELADVPGVIDGLRAAGVALTRVDTHRPTLEELYFELRRRHRETTGGDTTTQTDRSPSGDTWATNLAGRR